METVSAIFQWLIANWSPLLIAICALLTGLWGVLTIIPGNQGEAFLDKIIQFIKKITFNNPSEKK
jgi:ABC-type uncharacterized transport system permease subunit